jgi:hypothetical protein
MQKTAWAGLIAAIVMTGCANGYKDFYKPVPDATPDAIARLRVAPAPAVPEVVRLPPSSPKQLLDTYAKRGYVMIGSSEFNSGQSEDESAAIRQGQAVGADMVVILNPRYTGSVTTSIPITMPTTTTAYSTGTATAYGPRGAVTAYGSGTTTTYGSTTNYMPLTINRMDYAAVYFVKQKFHLGAFARDLNDSERQELQTNKGVVLNLIADNTPAFDGDLLVGDVVVAIDGVSVVNAESYMRLVRERSGKKISIDLLRRGERLHKEVQLLP